MCSGGILHSRLKRVVFGARDPKTGCAGSVLNLFAQSQLNHQTQVDSGLLEDECGQVLQRFFKHKREQQREMAVPLREDALRTPDRCFAYLPGYPWEAHFVSDLPRLSGLQMHFVDAGPRDSATAYLLIHPIPGWSYSYRHAMTYLLGQGGRVLAPDLIGFGKSDKPKREDAHSADFHVRYLLEWLARLDLHHVTLVLPHADHPLAQSLITQAPDRIHDLLLLPAITNAADAAEGLALNAPYPDAGHRAGERAFASKRLQPQKIKL
jgi:tRNA(adenine34) deaminase